MEDKKILKFDKGIAFVELNLKNIIHTGTSIPPPPIPPILATQRRMNTMNIPQNS
jgi:hypothetical protein